MPLTKVSFSVIQVANNVTSTTVGNTTSIPSFTFDQNGVITSASNTAISGAGITANTVANSAFQTGSVENYLRGANLDFGMRNRIINGDMRIDQRNAGAAVTINTTANVYTLDRWNAAGAVADGVFTVDQDTTAPTGFTNSAKITVTTADASIGADQSYMFTQFIEGFNVADLGWGTASAKTITVSFWVQSSVIGTFGGVLNNSDNSRNYPFTYAISVADTWEYKTVTIAGDTSGTWLTDSSRGIALRFGFGIGSNRVATAGAWTGTSQIFGATGQTQLISTLNATWYITGVQLEVGSTATSFDYRPYGTELSLCQRYYEVSTSDFSNPLFSGNVTSSAGYFANAVFKVTKRANPTVTLTNSFASNFPSTSGTAASISPESFYEPRTANGTGGGYFSSTFKASAEL